VDVGRGQLHDSLARDPRVVVVDRVNARALTALHVPEPCGIATADVSFISVRKMLSPLRAVLAPDADAVVLVKPQFEVGRGQVGRGGIVKDPELHLLALRTVAEAAIADSGYAVRGACPSPIAGTEGNREFFLHLRNGDEGMSAAELAEAVERAVRG
jgi:23S rRNA (cytidine1920-2'-O)/16S rRNA (cytidine1409-2'-O)-methyltransferase